MKIIVISPSKTSETETKTVTQLFEHGLEIFHLRKPSMSTNEMRDYLNSIPAHFHNRIVIHSHHGLAKKYNLKGIHLTREHLKHKIRNWFRLRMIKMRHPGVIVTTSFHKLSGIYQNNKKYDYVLLGTIFDALSEKFNAGYNEHSLRAAIAKSCTPIIARGGTNSGNVKTCFELGFSGMIFYSGIWKKEKPLEEFCKIVEECLALKSTKA